MLLVGEAQQEEEHIRAFQRDLRPRRCRQVGRLSGRQPLKVHLMPRYAGDSPDPRGGVRWIVPAQAAYWKKRDP
jgi:hypothetical protein